jgi:hypothetical protein
MMTFMQIAFNRRRWILAVSLALTLALPTCFEQAWHLGPMAAVLVLLNLPGMLVGLVKGRFFPPEGIIGQSPVHFVFMLLIQSVVWYLVISLITLLTPRKNRR